MDNKQDQHQPQHQMYLNAFIETKAGQTYNEDFVLEVFLIVSHTHPKKYKKINHQGGSCRNQKQGHLPLRVATRNSHHHRSFLYPLYSSPNRNRYLFVFNWLRAFHNTTNEPTGIPTAYTSNAGIANTHSMV